MTGCSLLAGSVYLHAGLFHVREYGAVADDKTDNTAALTLLRNITVTGKHGFSIGQLNIENAGPGQTDAINEWQKLTHDLNDPQNLGTGDITYWVVLGGVGAVKDFTRNGGANIRTRRIGTKP